MSGALDGQPLWVVFLVTCVLFLASLEGGFRLGRRLARRGQKVHSGTVTGATLGLLAFLLAFTFGVSEARFDARRQLVASEANVLHTTFLRAQLLPAPARERLAELLVTYTRERIAFAGAHRDPALDAQRIASAEGLQRRMWEEVVAVARTDPTAPVGLFAGPFNQLTELHGQRVESGSRHRIAPTILVTLYVVGLIALWLVGFDAGLGGGRSPLVFGALTLTIATVVLLILDLDRPGQTLFRVGHDALVEALGRMGAAP